MMDTQGKNRVKTFFWANGMKCILINANPLTKSNYFLKNELLKEKNGIDVSLSESEEKEREIG